MTTGTTRRAAYSSSTGIGQAESRHPMHPFELSAEHLAAVERRRRIVVRYDITGDPKDFVGEPPPPDQLAKWWDAQLSLQDMPGTQIDSIIWWSEGGVEASFKSDVRPVGEWIKGWVEAGVEIPSLALEQSHRRGIESFYQLAMNGYDVGWDGTKVVPATIPEKAAHPEWLLWPYGHVESGFVNYAVPGVRDYITEIVREVAWRFDHDGINLDFARVDVLLPPGHQWELREHLNDLMRTVRAVLLERARVRGRPYLLSVQIPPDVLSCHYTGIDIETWVREGLVDILILGCRTFDVDVRDFRRLTAGHPVKLYPCIDAHHSSDGYVHPSLEVQRGAAANWLHQGADGVCTFNYPDRTPESARRAGTYTELMETDYWRGCMRAQRELGTLETLRRTDKVFFAERRGGGHFMIPPPEDWSTPRAMSLNTNLLAQLPALLPNIPTGTPQPKEDWPGPPGQSDYRDGKVDTFVRVWVGDDVNAEADAIRAITVRAVLSDGDASDGDRLDPMLLATKYRDLYNRPPRSDVVERIELRLNNIMLPPPIVEDGWLVFEAQPAFLAHGENLVGVWVNPPEASAERLTLEKLEIHVGYR